MRHTCVNQAFCFSNAGNMQYMAQERIRLKLRATKKFVVFASQPYLLRLRNSPTTFTGHRREFTAPHRPVDLGITYIFLNRNALYFAAAHKADYINNGNFFTSLKHEYPQQEIGMLPRKPLRNTNHLQGHKSESR